MLNPLGLSPTTCDACEASGQPPLLSRLVLAALIVFAGCLVDDPQDSGTAGAAREPLQHGDRLVGTVFEDSLGRSVEISEGRPWLIVYLAGDNVSAASRGVYLDILSERFPSDELGLLGILGPAQDDVAVRLEERGLGYPILRDSMGALATQLGLEEPASYLWMVDEEGTVDFLASGWMLQDADLRQLVEKEVLGEVTYFDRDRSAPLQTGDSFPALTVDEVRSGERFQLDPRQSSAEPSFNRLVVFSPDCVNCSLSGALSRLEREIGELQTEDREVAAVFSSRFSPVEIASEVSHRALPIPLLVALDEIAGIEDRYYLQSLHSQVTVVDLGPEGRVEDISTLNAFEAKEEPDSSSNSRG